MSSLSQTLETIYKQRTTRTSYFHLVIPAVKTLIILMKEESILIFYLKVTLHNGYNKKRHFNNCTPININTIRDHNGNFIKHICCR